MELQCNKCKEIKFLTDFHKQGISKIGVRKTCKKCMALKHSKDNRTKLHNRERKLKAFYGIDIAGYNSMFDKQNGCCAICKTHQSQLTVTLSVDHCHTTKRVRGLLCYNCNSGLGRFKDNKIYLAEAIEYLK